MRLGLSGYVRNVPDGTMEVEIEGGEDAVEPFLAWLAKGPRFAHVDTLDVSDLEPVGDHGFRVS